MKDYPIKLGTMLFTMVEPHAGHEVEYNRWYERDHFYAGCMIGANNFAGQRFVATAGLKALRFPREPNPMTPDPSRGSYLALYWILADHHDEWNRWAVDQVNWLHANGRMFAARDHIHTLLYNFEWDVRRDPDGVSPELALDHRYPGIGVVVAEAAGDRAEMEQWYREYLARIVPGSAIGQVLAFTPRPLLVDAPGDIPRSEAAEQRLMLVFFCDRTPDTLWEETFVAQAKELESAGRGTVLWASPFLPTIPGTDTYTDQL